MVCILNVIHYFSLMFLKILEKICLEMYEKHPAKFVSAL